MNPANLYAGRKFTSMRIESVMASVPLSNGRWSSPTTAACMSSQTYHRAIIFSACRRNPGTRVQAIACTRLAHLDIAQPAVVNPALDVAYPTTFYPNAIDSDDAIPIPIRGGERIEANMTLNAQHALRLQLHLAIATDGGVGVSMAHNVFGQLEPMYTSTQTNNQGDVEISGVIPGQYEVTVTHSRWAVST